MVVSAKELAHLLQGKVEGNPEEQVNQFAKIEEAQKGALSFFANPKYEQYVYTTQASILLVANTFKASQAISATLIRVEDPYAALAFLLDQFGKAQQSKKTGISKWAAVPEGTQVGANAYVGDFVSIGNKVKLGEDVCIESNVSLGDNVVVGEGTILLSGVRVMQGCVIGANCVLHAGVVIGSDGFGFAPQADGTFKKVSQVGKVIIEDDVEIGANATIDRGSIGDTIIRRGVKLDNLVHIAHNVEVGEHTVIAAQTGVAGSTKIGKGCMIGGQVGIVGHIHIADGTKINAQSGVSKSIEEPNMVVTGTPAFAYKSALRAQAVFRRLPDIEKQIAVLNSILKK